MLTAIIPTLESERSLVPTLGALVPGATAGLISEVLITDGGSRDDTAGVADIAGCTFMVAPGPLGLRLRSAAGKARAPWLLFLRPGIVLDPSWTAEVGRFIEHSGDRAAVFRCAAPVSSALREMLSLFAAALGGRPRPEQGLLISRQLYEKLGGHSERAAEPETELLRRIGRKRLVRLSSGALPPGRYLT